MKAPASPRYRITSPAPEKPLFVFDGSCGFCRACAGRGQILTRGGVVFAASQEVAPRQSGVPQEAFERSSVLIAPDGEVFTGAESVLRALAIDPSRRLPLTIYESVPGAARAAEMVYRIVARNRPLLTRLTRHFTGGPADVPEERAGSCGPDPGSAD